MMLQSRNRNRCRIEFQICCQQFFDGCKNRNGVFGFGFGSARCVRLNRRDQGDPLVGGFKLTIDTKMIAAESSGSNYGNA